MRKLRVLWCGEASFLSTGFGTYALEVLRRLHASGKYELTEYAAYSEHGDPRGRELPWRHLSAMYDPSVPGQREAYESDPYHQFGAFRFEEACLKTRPDVVVDYRDHWYMRHEALSPLRRYYRLAWMPTVDAEPQDPGWLADYVAADAVFTYSDWGAEVLRREGGGRVRLWGAAPPGADAEACRPTPDRRAHRAACGVDPDALVVGTVMRNQPRKLYPDLLEAFAAFRRSAPPGLARRSYLYLHTAWPDVGWDLPALLREHGLCSRALFSYHCQACGRWFPAFFRGPRTQCRCGGQALFPRTQLGLKRADLAGVYNLFDAYVQYASNEGFGMPMVEAAACGLPVLATDYSAMADVVRKVQGVPLRVKAMTRDAATGCRRAVPDGGHLVAELARVLGMPEAERAAWGLRARREVLRHYDWDQTAERWMRCLDSFAPWGERQGWDAPPLPHRPARAEDAPPGLDSLAWVRWGMHWVAGRPDLADSHLALRMAADLEAGVTQSGQAGRYLGGQSLWDERPTRRAFGRKEAAAVFTQLAEVRDRWEAARSR